MLAAVSLSNMAGLVLPPAIATVILCADNDGDNQQAAALVDRAARRFASEGRGLRIARAAIGKDFNDTLRAGEPHGAPGGWAA